MERILVTGVSGFVGHHLVDELVGRGWGVIGVSRDKDVNQALGSKLERYIQCDLADYEAVSKLPLSEVSAVINLAGLAAVGPSFDNPEIYMKVNTSVIDTICKAVVEQNIANIRILAVSSGAVYDASQPLPLTEDSALDPSSSPYAKSKIAMEQVALSYRNRGVDCVVVRPFNHIGPGQAEGFLLPDLYKRVADAQKNNSPLLVGNLTTKRDYTDVRDVAKAYASLAAAEKLKHSIYNVCSGQPLSGEEILSMLLNELVATSMAPTVDKDLFRPSDAPVQYGNNNRLCQDTSWKVTIDIEQTIADFVRAQN